MTHLILDRVLETTTTTGTGIITLNGNVAGFRAFSLLGNGNTTDYLIIDEDRNQWEIGIGTYGSSGNTLSRTTVVLSTNSNNAVNFQTGTKYVKITNAASKTITTDNISTYAQPADADLTAIAALTGTTGLLKKTAANTWTLDTTSYYSSGSNASFGTLSASSTVSGVGFSNYLASPPAIGSTAASTGAFTTLSASSTVTLSGGTANGVAYLNASKVLTTGSALTFDGTNLGIGTNAPVAFAKQTILFEAGGSLTQALALLSYGGSPAISFRQASGTVVSPGASNTSVINLIGSSTSDGTNFFNTVAIQGSLETTATTGSHPTVITFATTPTGSTSRTERMRIDSSGNVLVGVTSTASYQDGRFNVVAAGSQPAITGTISSTAGTQFVYSAWSQPISGNNQFMSFETETTATVRGSITYNRGAGLTAYNTTSDYRAKDIIGPIENSGLLIDSVPVYMGKMKGATQERPMFIAHETPDYAHTGKKDAVDEDGNPVYQQMDASALIPVMWAEIQSLRKRITTLEAK